MPATGIGDGVDQSDFFFGKQQMSNRDSVVIYVGNDLHAPGLHSLARSADDRTLFASCGPQLDHRRRHAEHAAGELGHAR